MIPPSGYERRKDPEKVRLALTLAAAHLIAERGLSRLTVDAVAKAAGVTKGGLFHHFPSKQDLVLGVLGAMIDFANETLEAMMATDPEPHGRFTRAYLKGVFADQKLGGHTSSRTLCLAMLADPDLQDGWGKWVEGRIALHAATDDNPACALVRLAADGAWLNSLQHPTDPPPLPAEVFEMLMSLTYPSR
ncbi:MAG: TetR/AcrR family transcriptional regulator [Sphingomonas sp.]|jgi:AcrR family transcriptional regulator|uniref:TetR/AcrR family transcriptional regulator n=1 Tax=Sphingomonas sp. TaxID=28214 RepID=UPI00356646BF